MAAKQTGKANNTKSNELADKMHPTDKPADKKKHAPCKNSLPT